MASISQNRLLGIKFSTILLDSARIIATTLRAVETLSGISRYQLKLISLYSIDVKVFLNQHVRIVIQQYHRCRYIHGEIINAKKMFHDSTVYYHYKILVHAIPWQLNQKIDCRIFHQKNIQELCQILFKTHGLTHYQFNFMNKHPPYVCQTQYDESTLNFLHRLFNEERIFYYSQHLANHSKLIISDTLKGYQFLKTPIVFEIGRYHGLHIYDWQYNHRSLSIINAPIQITAKSNVHTLCPGDVFKLKNHPLPSMISDYVVTKIIHDADDYSFLPAFKHKIINYYKNIITCVPILNAHHIFIKTIIPKINGIQVAQVIKAFNNRAHNDSGQVRVLFPWDYRQSGSAFIAVKQPLADKYCGVQFFPKAGDQVVVTFEQNNPNKPIIIGSIYAKKIYFPFNVDAQGFTTDHGHALSFSNQLNEKQMNIKSSMNMQSLIQGDYHITVKNNFTTTIQKGTCTINAESFKIQATQSIKLSSQNGSIKITPNEITLIGSTIFLN